MTRDYLVHLPPSGGRPCSRVDRVMKCDVGAVCRLLQPAQGIVMGSLGYARYGVHSAGKVPELQFREPQS